MRKVIVNFSGGKDSTVAILECLKKYPTDEIILCYQNTGADYLETPDHIRRIAQILDLPLVELQAKRDFWQEVERRKFFPDPAVRYCTSRLKRDVLNKWLSENFRGTGIEVIVVSGIRAEESKSRARKHEWETVENSHLVKSVSKVWNPCLNMTIQEVKDRVVAEGLPLHPCYEFSTRANCWCCIFAHPNEVRAYAEMQPKLYEEACLLEDRIKNKWKYRFGFNDLMKQGRLL